MDTNTDKLILFVFSIKQLHNGNNTGPRPQDQKDVFLQTLVYGSDVKIRRWTGQVCGISTRSVLVAI